VIRKAQKRRALEVAVERRLKRRTRLLAGLAASSAVTVFGIEFFRIWRLGTLGAHRTGAPTRKGGKQASRSLVLVLREGMRVTSTHENALFAMLASFLVTFSTARWVTFRIRRFGRVGPFSDVYMGSRHIHHFVPGAVIGLLAGGVAIASRDQKLDSYLALPFGMGVALVLDEAALLLELRDVYWAEEGLLSIDVAFGAICLLASLAYLTRLFRRGELRAREMDWMVAAHAWDELQRLPGSARSDR
jgi:hypothetical protein